MYDVFEVLSGFPAGYTSGIALAANDRVVGVDHPAVGPGGGFVTLWSNGHARQFAVDATIESPSSVNAEGVVVGTWFDPTVLELPTLVALSC